MAFVTLAGSLISLPFLPFVENPAPASWPFLAATILLHTGYHFFLPVAYDHGDLGQVYPMARGSAPILVTVGAFMFAGETLEPLAIVGVLCLAVGVITLTFDKTSGIAQRPRAVCFALATGACIASYTVVDGLGARHAGSALGFAVWLTIGDGLLTFLVALACVHGGDKLGQWSADVLPVRRIKSRPLVRLALWGSAGNVCRGSLCRRPAFRFRRGQQPP